MKIPLIFALICLNSCLNACSYQYTAQAAHRFAQVVEISPHVHLHRLRQITLLPSDSLCLSPAAAGDTFFQRALNEQFQRSLQQRFGSVFTLPIPAGESSALHSARSQNCGLLVVPMVLANDDKPWSVVEWDAEIESWSDMGVDRLQLRIAVWDVNSARMLDLAVVSSRRPRLQISANSSRDLLSLSINAYLEQLVAVQ